MQGNRVDCTAFVDAFGVLALGTDNVLEPQNGAIHFVSRDGALRGSAPSGTNAFLLGRYSTFEGVAFTGKSGAEAYSVEAWDDSGQPVYIGPSRSGNMIAVEDPLGGVAVLVRGNGSPVVENYDERGTLRWSTTLSSQLTAIGAFVVDRQGNTFVTADSATFDKSVVAQWIDHGGTAGAAFKLLGPQSEWTHLEGFALVRVGGGVFVHADTWWQLDSMATTVAPPPAWFMDRNPNMMAGFQMVRNGRAYGIVSMASGPDCTATVEIVTPSGTSCGKATFSAGPGSCTWANASIGYDGTFVQRVPPPADQCSGGVCSCTWHWWSGFFR
ncbi:MAG: hypothetical protein LC689_07350 [Myxococcales bacterium]|nr:hypothetical protein [Myxococcales bacterium]